VKAWRIASVGPGLRALTSLRSLLIECQFLGTGDDEEKQQRPEPASIFESLFAEEDPEPYVHPPLLAEDLQPLTNLRFLTVSHCAPCLASVLLDGLPSLEQLVMWGGPSTSFEDYDQDAFDQVTLGVLRSVWERVKRNDGLQAWLAPIQWASEAPRPFDSEDCLDALVEHHRQDFARYRQREHNRVHREVARARAAEAAEEEAEAEAE
jgi:hypothetical protein